MPVVLFVDDLIECWSGLGSEPLPPLPPGNVEVTPMFDTQVHITWDMLDSPVVVLSYLVEYTQVDHQPQNVLTHHVQGSVLTDTWSHSHHVLIIISRL